MDTTSRAGEPGLPSTTGGELREGISNVVVKVFADHMGRGPTKVRSFVDGDIVVCLLQETMTKAERSLVKAGREATVLRMRSDFQETMREELVAGIEELTGRGVIAFVSGNSIDPDLASELFVLEGCRKEGPRREPRRLVSAPSPKGLGLGLAVESG
jgi:uncharacterized protein YbcI